MRKALWMMVLGAGLAAFPAHADEDDRDRRLRELEQAMARMQKELEALRKEKPAEDEIRVKALEEQVEDLRNKEKRDEKNGTPLRTFYKDGIKLKSDDGNFDLSVGGRIIENGRFFVQTSANDNTFYNKETQIELKGKVYKQYKYEIEATISGTSGTMNNSFVEYEQNEAFGIKFGQFKEPFLLEETSSTLWRDFPEKSVATRLAPSRDIGVQIAGKFFEKRLGYELAYFNGMTKNTTETNDDKDVAARLTWVPFAPNKASALNKLQMFVMGTWGRQDNNTPASFSTTDSGTTFLAFNSTVRNHEDRSRKGAGLIYAKGPASFKGEFASMSMDLLKPLSGTPMESQNTRFDAWYATVGWVLTGEDAVIYNRLVPSKPFKKGKEGWGAFEILGRLSGFQAEREPFVHQEKLFASSIIGTESALAGTGGVGSTTDMLGWTVGLNWTPISNARAMVSYGENHFGANYIGTFGADTRKKERFVMLSTQFDF